MIRSGRFPAASAVLVVALVAASSVAHAQTRPPTPPASTPVAARSDTAFVRTEFIIEGGLALPAGDLAASFDHAANGFSAGPGYALGLRMRWYASRTFVVSPSFQFVKYREHEDYDAAGERFHIATAQIRFGIDAIHHAAGRFHAWRPYVGLGVELVQNRYQETFDEDDSTYEADATGFGPRLLAGVRSGDFEFALTLHFCDFTTPRFFYTGDETAYSWDAAQIMVSYVLPRL